MRRRILKVAGALAVVALAGVAGATYAASQDGDEKGPSGGTQPAAINTALVPEAKFVPIAPCRIMDTRNTSGKINPGTVRAFDAFGGNLSAQGGTSSGCGIPSYAEAIEINLTAVAPAGTGWLRGAAQNSYLLLNPDPGTSQTLPNATLVNYSTALNASNSVTIPLCGGNGESTGGFLILFACSGTKEFRIGAFNKATSVVGDATGYFVAPAFAVIDGDPAGDPVKIRSNDMGTATHTGTGVYEIATSRDLRGCAIMATGGNSNEETTGSDVQVAVTNIDNNSIGVRVYQNGVLADDDWSVVATC
jgi:hypothetical protein